MRTLGFYLYLLFVASWFLHLTARLEFLGAVRFDLVLIALIGVTLVLSGRDPGAKNEADTNRLLKILMVYIVLTLPVVEWPGTVIRTGIPNFAKAVVFYFFTSAFVTTRKRLASFMFVFLACQSFRVVEPVFLHVTQGYWGSAAHMEGDEFLARLAGSPFDVVNPNGLAFVILTVYPFLHFLSKASLRGRLFYWALAPVLVYALILTGSRSGLLGFFVILMGIFIKTRRKFVMGVVVAAAAMVAVAHLSSDLADRYTSIYNKDSKNAATVDGRIEGVKRNFRVALHRPIFGHGLGTSAEAGANFGGYGQIAHNLYAEIAQELGFAGLFIFLLYMKSSVKGFFRGYAGFNDVLAGRPFYRAMVDAMQVWLIMNIVFSWASYGLSGYEWYMFGGLAVALKRLVEREQSDTRVRSRVKARVPDFSEPVAVVGAL